MFNHIVYITEDYRLVANRFGVFIQKKRRGATLALSKARVKWQTLGAVYLFHGE